MKAGKYPAMVSGFGSNGGQSPRPFLEYGRQARQSDRSQKSSMPLIPHAPLNEAVATSFKASSSANMAFSWLTKLPFCS